MRQYYKLVDERCVHSPQQRWYYFPNITPGETLLFRQYDTREEAPNRRTVFHTAAVDPTSPTDAHDRFTIEVRMQAVYGHEGQEAKAARVQRWKEGITSVYPDGTESTWFSGPIEDYVPPENVEERLEVAKRMEGTEHERRMREKESAAKL